MSKCKVAGNGGVGEVWVKHLLSMRFMISTHCATRLEQSMDFSCGSGFRHNSEAFMHRSASSAKHTNGVLDHNNLYLTKQRRCFSVKLPRSGKIPAMHCELASDFKERGRVSVERKFIPYLRGS